jgi:hypothetical protein
VKSFDKETKQEQISQISYSEIFNNHDYENDISNNYDQEHIVVLNHPAVFISYQADVFDDDIYYIIVPNSCQIFSFQEKHQQFKEVVSSYSLELKFLQVYEEGCTYVFLHDLQDRIVDWFKFVSFQSSNLRHFINTLLVDFTYQLLAYVSLLLVELFSFLVQICKEQFYSDINLLDYLHWKSNYA